MKDKIKEILNNCIDKHSDFGDYIYKGDFDVIIWDICELFNNSELIQNIEERIKILKDEKDPSNFMFGTELNLSEIENLKKILLKLKETE